MSGMFIVCSYYLLFLTVSPSRSALRVHDMSLHSSSHGVSPLLLKKLYTSFLSYLTEQLVEAYAKAKKCTPEGRGSMTLDLSALRSGLEKLTNLKPLPHWDFVLGWVNAYYLQESELIAWVAAHPEYSMAQVISVAQCGCGANISSKERLVLVGNVTNAHTAAVDKALAERKRNGANRKAGDFSSLSVPSTPATPATSSSRPLSRSASRPGSQSNSRVVTPSSSSTNLAQMDQLSSATKPTAPATNGHAAHDQDGDELP
jgi:hypothetical protein